VLCGCNDQSLYPRFINRKPGLTYLTQAPAMLGTVRNSLERPRWSNIHRTAHAIRPELFGLITNRANVMWNKFEVKSQIRTAKRHATSFTHLLRHELSIELH